MYDNFLAEEVVEIRVSFKGESFINHVFTQLMTCSGHASALVNLFVYILV